MLRVIRLAYYRTNTIGVLYINGHPRMMTLEDPWVNNMFQVSCIPVGEYKCTRWKSPRFGETFKVLNVPNRSDILFHEGNSSKDTKGCILLGTALDPFKDDWISGSLAARTAFMKLMQGISETVIVISDALPNPLIPRVGNGP